MNEQLQRKLYNKGSKKILSLDGGGIRGILTLGMLKKIESLAQNKTGNKNLVLGEYYDLIAGTSTGAIIASGLAVGKTVDEIISLYLNLGKEIFDKGRKWRYLKREWTTLRAAFSENYSSKNLEKYLHKTFGDINIGDQENIVCGLAINSKRADTYSLWTVANHPNGIYYRANAHLKLWELCRASSAAPYYFRPKKLNLKTRKDIPFEAVFIDGGISLANNPAWETFLISIIPTFGFCYEKGVENISITTLGTGNGQKKENPEKLIKYKSVMWAPKLSDLFMVDALETNQVLLEMFGETKGSHYSINSQIDPIKDIPIVKKGLPILFAFDRHNVSLTSKALGELGFDLDETKINSLKEMDHFENMNMLLSIGKKYAENNIKTLL